MSYDIIHCDGTPWWVYYNVTGNALNVDLVTPEALSVGNMASGTGVRAVKGGRLVICWFHYDFIAANGNGFDLAWEEPAGTNRTIITPRASTAITRCEGTASDLWVMGPKGVPGGPTDAAHLRLTTTATGPTSGHILVGGIHVSDDSALFQGKGSYGTGSPISF